MVVQRGAPAPVLGPAPSMSATARRMRRPLPTPKPLCTKERCRVKVGPGFADARSPRGLTDRAGVREPRSLTPAGRPAPAARPGPGARSRTEPRGALLRPASLRRAPTASEALSRGSCAIADAPAALRGPGVPAGPDEPLQGRRGARPAEPHRLRPPRNLCLAPPARVRRPCRRCTRAAELNSAGSALGPPCSSSAASRRRTSSRARRGPFRIRSLA